MNKEIHWSNATEMYTYVWNSFITISDSSKGHSGAAKNIQEHTLMHVTSFDGRCHAQLPSNE